MNKMRTAIESYRDTYSLKCLLHLAILCVSFIFMLCAVWCFDASAGGLTDVSKTSSARLATKEVGTEIAGTKIVAEISRLLAGARDGYPVNEFHSVSAPEELAEIVFKKKQIQLKDEQLKLLNGSRSFPYRSLFYAYVTDLNGDKQREFLITLNPEKEEGVSMHNVPLYLYGRQGKAYCELLDANGTRIFLLSEKTSGYRNLIVTQNASASEDDIVMYVFREGRYQQSCCFQAIYQANGKPTIKRSSCNQI